jgi:hypothetical protein
MVRLLGAGLLLFFATTLLLSKVTF